MQCALCCIHAWCGQGDWAALAERMGGDHTAALLQRTYESYGPYLRSAQATAEEFYALLHAPQHAPAPVTPSRTSTRQAAYGIRAMFCGGTPIPVMQA